MSGTVFRQSLRHVARATLIVAAGTGAFFYLILLSSSAFLEDFAVPGQTPEFFREPPRAIEAFLGGSADFFSPAGWLSAGMLHPVVLALQTAGALMVAAGSVATELERGTIELVLARPVGRRAFLLAKAAASVVTLTVVHLGGLVGVLLARWTVRDVDLLPIADILFVFLGSWVLFASFAMAAVLISSRASLRARATGAAVGLVVLSFFVNFMALLFDRVAGVRFASPFHYFRPADILAGSAGLPDLGVLVAFGLGCLALALWSFARRDLTR